MDSASRLSVSAQKLMQSVQQMSGQATPTPQSSSPSVEEAPYSQPVSQPIEASPDTQPQAASQPPSFLDQAEQLGNQMVPDVQNTSQPQDQPTQESIEQAEADGQFSDEEIEYLRQTGRLPYVAPATPMQESALIPGAYKPMPEELLLEWIAPSRPFKKPKRNFFTTITIIGALIGLILFFANQWIPVAVVISVVFLIYVLYSIPPGDVHHALTTYGLRSEEKLYYWEELGRFWINQSKGQFVLNIEVARFPNRLSLLLGDIPSEDMTAILSEVLLNEMPPLTQVEKMAEWLKRKVPLDLED